MTDLLTGLLQLQAGLDHKTVAASVIAREPAEFRRAVTLDRGSDQGIEQGDVVIGAGGVGLTAVATLKALGHKRICVVDVAQRNLDIARELGASDVVQAGNKASKQIIEACGGPVEAVIDFVNNDGGGWRQRSALLLYDACCWSASPSGRW